LPSNLPAAEAAAAESEATVGVSAPATVRSRYYDTRAKDIAFEYLNKPREFESLVKQKVSNDDTLDRQKQAISDSVKEFFSAMH
jgi:hypothetical protein